MMGQRRTIGGGGEGKKPRNRRDARITLKPINPDFQPIELMGSEEGELQVVAELVEVLGDAL